MRPKECVAAQCNMSNGRDYCYDENDGYLLELCTCCGSNGVHKCCLDEGKKFTCNDCEPPSKKRRRLNDDTNVNSIDTIICETQPVLQASNKRRKIIKPIDQTDMNNNVQPNSSSEALTSASSADFVPLIFRIELPQLDQ